MPIDRKYGRVTLEKGTIPADEPVVVFRARDVALLEVLRAYEHICSHEGSPPEHLRFIGETYALMARWQRQNADKVKAPD